MSGGCRTGPVQDCPLEEYVNSKRTARNDYTAHPGEASSMASVIFPPGMPYGTLVTDRGPQDRSLFGWGRGQLFHKNCSGAVAITWIR